MNKEEKYLTKKEGFWYFITFLILFPIINTVVNVLVNIFLGGKVNEY